jgi:hypothetical protein
MVKIGTLHPDGSYDDLGEVNRGEYAPGADAERCANEKEWITAYDGDDALYVTKEPLWTGDFACLFGIAVDSAGETKEMYFSEELGDARFEDKEGAVKALTALSNCEKLAREWLEYDEDEPPNDEEIEEWAQEHVEYETHELSYTSLEVIPVTLPTRVIREICGEYFEHAEEAYKKDGDWRACAFDLHLNGSRAHIEGWSSWVLEGERPDADILTAKQAVLPMFIMFGMYMDRQFNAVGDSHWDILRDAGVVYVGDTVYWTGATEPQKCEVTMVEWAKNSVHLLNDAGTEFIVDLDDVRSPDLRERLRERTSAYAQTQEPDAPTEEL